MFSKKLTTLILAGLLVALVGCRTTPVHNVYESTVNATGSYKLKDVKDAILKAGDSLGWSMKNVKPGSIIATLYIREHMARVKITYSKKNFSIVYSESAGLKYDGVNIHKNYNGWVKNLERRINSNINSL